MADYQCWPLWDEDEPDNVDPASLGLSATLQERLTAWADDFEEGFNWDDPAASPDREPGWAEAFDATGRALAADVQRELGPDAVVRYWRDRVDP
jgi:hypothetical protein